MDTQNTPVHIKLWHKDFWRLCFANLLLMSSVYMLVFVIPYFLLLEKFQMWQIGCVLLAYGFGLFLFGGFCSYLVQRYRRNMVCQLSILGVVVCLSVLYYLDTFWNIRFSFEILLAVRFLLGAFLGLAQMSLASTLVIDSCESFQRTEANYITLLVCPLFNSRRTLGGMFCLQLFRHGLCFPYGFVAGFGSLRAGFSCQVSF